MYISKTQVQQQNEHYRIFTAYFTFPQLLLLGTEVRIPSKFVWNIFFFPYFENYKHVAVARDNSAASIFSVLLELQIETPYVCPPLLCWELASSIFLLFAVESKE